MADYGSLQSPISKSPRPISSFFNSPRLFTSLSQKAFHDTDSSIMSPTSILDSKTFCGFKYPLKSESTPDSEPKHPWEKMNSKRVGLGIVDDLIDEESNPNLVKPESRMVLFGSPLRIQIPPMPNSAFYPIESPKLPPDFGTKSKNLKLGCFSQSLSPSSAKNSKFGSSNSNLETKKSSSASETEISEDFLYELSLLPNTKTSHVFEKCFVDNCCGVLGFSASKQGNGLVPNSTTFPSENFLSFCLTCRKILQHGKDIYMYRGEKAFCSSECRYQEMLLEEEMEKIEYDDDEEDDYGACS